MLSIIWILHQTTTYCYASFLLAMLSIIWILHQTTTQWSFLFAKLRCQLSEFYIKPQPNAPSDTTVFVVNYLNSTSNHNCNIVLLSMIGLSIIWILHQTTTIPLLAHALCSCQLSEFYIKPQPYCQSPKKANSCQLSEFYIKPQLQFHFCVTLFCCQLSEFYIKPQP